MNFHMILSFVMYLLFFFFLIFRPRYFLAFLGTDSHVYDADAYVNMRVNELV